MADQAEAKKILNALIRREDLQNKVCADCSNPNPQWASVSFAIFLCLQCAGLHRGYGVHVSFVRSVSMDTWQEEQIKRMEIGGNKPFKDFMKSYDPTTSGYTENQSSYDTYHSWAATQYREKLDALLLGKDWSPSAPKEDAPDPGRPSSAQGLRKSRTSGRSATGSSLRNDSASPASFNRSSPAGTPSLSAQDQKAQNETYFSKLGEANAARPDNLPPSQGGRYQGFGSTPPPSQHPSYGMSSAATPSLGEFQENPMAALSKGWSLFSSAVAGASKAVNENVIQPGIERASDPNLHANIRGYMSEAQRRAASAGSAANQWGKNSLGVDVAGRVGDAVGTMRGPDRSQYGSLATEHENETSALYSNEDFFDSLHNNPATTSPVQEAKPTAASKKKDGWEDDDWKDF